MLLFHITYSKPVQNGHSPKDHNFFFKTNYRLMQIKLSIAECLKGRGRILQYIRPSLSYNLSFRSLFCLFFSGRFVQVLYRFYYMYICINLSLVKP